MQILEIHRESFPLITRVTVPLPPPIDAGRIFARHRAQAIGTTYAFNRSKRQAALTAARQAAEQEVATETAAQARSRYERQGASDEVWAALERCDPETTLNQLDSAFSDNEAAASAVGIDGTEATLVVIAPPESAVPDRAPGVTPSGNISIKALNKTDRASLYKSMVCGYMVVTLKEAFAVAPALTGAHIVAIRISEPDVYGRRHPEAIMGGHCEPAALRGVQWEKVDAIQVFDECLTSHMLTEVGATRTLQPLSTADLPGLAALLEAIDFEGH